MSIGTITVDLLARTGSFETDMNRAAKVAEKRAKEIDAAVTKAGTAVGQIMAAVGAATVYAAKQIVDGLDALNDVADATGSTVEKISALENVAMTTGTSMDTVTGAMTKFNDTLKNADGKNGPSLALKAIGLSAQELKSIDPAEALRRTAVALSGFADDGNKARLVQELFGKSVKEVAPFLKDLAEQTELVGKVSAEQAANAEAFNKQIFAMKTQALEAARSITSQLLPALTSFLQNARDINKLGGLGLIVKDAAKDVFGLGKLTGNDGADIKQFMRERERLRKDLEYASRKGFPTRGIEGDLAENARFLAILRAKQANDVAIDSLGQDYGDAVSRKFLRPENVKFDGGPKGGGAGAKSAPKESEYQKYLENLQKELDRTEELTRAAMVLADVNSGRLKLEKGESLDVLIAKAKQIDANKALNEENKRAIEFENQLREARARAAEGLEKEALALLEGNNSMRQEIGLIGKNAEQQAALEQARLDELIAAKQQDLARQQSANSYTRETAALEEQIRLLTERRELVGLRGTTQKLADDAKKTEELANSVGASFSGAFEKAIVDGEKLSDVLQGLAKDIAALAIRQAITVPISNSIGTALSGLFGLGGGYSAADQAGLDGLIAGLISGKRANGGPVGGGQTYLVGERGPELFTPNTAGKIIPNHALGGGGGQGVTVVQNFTVGDVATVSAVREAVANSERRIAGQIGRSRQYGGALA